MQIKSRSILCLSSIQSILHHKNMISRLLAITSSLFILCTLSLCFIIYHVENSSASGFTNETDRQALLAIKDLISIDPIRALSSWNTSLHFCSWRGVTCGRRRQRVTALKLQNLQLTGSLSPHVGNLTFLREINLSTNNFHGAIPQEFGRLYRLQNLSLHYNFFQGEPPRNLSHCTNLRNLNLGGNNLSGKLPTQLVSLPRLRTLLLFKNYFTGSIPPSFGNLSSLAFLSLASNKLEGSIPIELESLSNLEFLSFSINKFSGMFPQHLCNISSISVLSLTDNEFSGGLPVDLFSKLSNLRTIFLALNTFFGPIPTSIVNASRLEEVDFGANHLTGPVPNNLGNLQNLQSISFILNPLGTGLTFLTSLTNCTNLRMINLLLTQLRGFLPNSIANLSTNLQWLALDENYITGDIPAEIGNLKSLEYLGVSANKLTGRLPESIGKLSKLQEFYAYQNKISGKIPSSLGNISGLLRLSIGENLLEGTMPASIGNCYRMEALEVTQNNLNGFIPETIFDLSGLTLGLYLGENEFIGELPSQVGNLRDIIALNVSENRLSGEIPATLGNCLMLETLLMQVNFFEGTIPSSFKKLTSLRFLDLSSNNLSGQIPLFLAELPLLENLNLSLNDFEGEVPTEGVFKNVSAFSIAGNHNLCGGIKEIQLPACPKKRQNHRISRRVVILATSTVSLLILSLLACVFLVIYRKRSHKRKPILVSPLEKTYQKVSYGDLVQATDGFSASNMIGDGRYGTVYKGNLRSDDRTVAVKVLKLQQRGADKTFVAECETLRSIRHRNLVRIVTACSTIDFKGNDFKALIFEFMPNGSLESWLHPTSVELQDSERLSLMQRVNMLIDVASALDYLHNHCEITVVHCDLKPSNILLDDDLTAHVGDFGLSKVLSAATGDPLSTSTSSFGVRGTVGYAAPEYGMGGEVSIQGDVYSYGILLLEMFTGKRPTDSMFMGDNSLHNFVKTALPDHVTEIIDPLLAIDIQVQDEPSANGPSSNRGRIGGCLISILQIGVLCSAELPRERMVIADVLSDLNKIKKILCS